MVAFVLLRQGGTDDEAVNFLVVQV